MRKIKLCQWVMIFILFFPFTAYSNELKIDEILKVITEIKNSQDISAGIDYKNIREQFAIPAAVQVLSPSGGEEVGVFIYNAKEYKSNVSQNIFYPEKIRHITSNKNLEKVFLLFYFEPFIVDKSSIDGHSYAVAITPSDEIKAIEGNKSLITLTTNAPAYIKSANKIIVVKKIK